MERTSVGKTQRFKVSLHGRKSRRPGHMSPTFWVGDGLDFCPLGFLYKLTTMYLIFRAVFGQLMLFNTAMYQIPLAGGG